MLHYFPSGIPDAFEPILLGKSVFHHNSISLGGRCNFEKVLVAFVLPPAIVSPDFCLFDTMHSFVVLEKMIQTGVVKDVIVFFPF